MLVISCLTIAVALILLAEKEGKEIKIAPETQKLNWYVAVVLLACIFAQCTHIVSFPAHCSISPTLLWSHLSHHPCSPARYSLIQWPKIMLIKTLCRKLNTSPASLDEKDILKKPLCAPMVKKVDLHFPLGLEVTARNLKGVTIKDALDAIYKQFKKKVNLPLIAVLISLITMIPNGAILA